MEEMKKPQRIKEELDTLNGEIDELVMDLFKLTPEEKKVVLEFNI